MNESQAPPLRQGMIWTLALLALTVALGSGAGGDSPTGTPESEKPSAHEPSPPASSPGSPRAAARAVLDPETGELTSGTVEIEWRQSSPRLRERLSRRSDDLHEEPLQGGGFMVDLRGRFHTLLVAEVETDGGLRTYCVGTSPRQAEPVTEPGSARSAAGEADAHGQNTGSLSATGGNDG